MSLYESYLPCIPADIVPHTPDTAGTDSPRGSRFGGTYRSSLRSHGSMDSGDIDLAMVPRPSDVEGLGGASPLRELLNYCTGISFEGFLSAESESTVCEREFMCMRGNLKVSWKFIV